MRNGYFFSLIVILLVKHFIYPTNSKQIQNKLNHIVWNRHPLDSPTALIKVNYYPFGYHFVMAKEYYNLYFY